MSLFVQRVWLCGEIIMRRKIKGAFINVAFVG